MLTPADSTWIWSSWLLVGSVLAAVVVGSGESLFHLPNFEEIGHLPNFVLDILELLLVY